MAGGSTLGVREGDYLVYPLCPDIRIRPFDLAIAWEDGDLSGAQWRDAYTMGITKKLLPGHVAIHTGKPNGPWPKCVPRGDSDTPAVWPTPGQYGKGYKGIDTAPAKSAAALRGVERWRILCCNQRWQDDDGKMMW